MEVFLLSNGKIAGDPQWLSYAKDDLSSMIKKRGIRSAVLIAYAVIRSDHDKRARELEAALGIQVTCIEHFDSAIDAINNAEFILVSGGNTWLLNQMLHEKGLVVPIQRAVRERNVPYLGWSAGCNVATPTIRTTNDMPVRSAVVMPSLSLFPVQINPHYIDGAISGHMGETRDERLAEFCAMNPEEIVVAIREGSYLHITGDELHYHSGKDQGFKIFQHGKTFPEQFDTKMLAEWVPFRCF